MQVSARPGFLFVLVVAQWPSLGEYGRVGFPARLGPPQVLGHPMIRPLHLDGLGMVKNRFLGRMGVHLESYHLLDFLLGPHHGSG